MMATIYIREVLELSERLPYSFFVIDKVYWKCRTFYHPRQKALEKCETICNTAREFGISLDEAIEVQLVIDLELL
jgi:hypothetical protein